MESCFDEIWCCNYQYYYHQRFDHKIIMRLLPRAVDNKQPYYFIIARQISQLEDSPGGCCTMAETDECRLLAGTDFQQICPT